MLQNECTLRHPPGNEIYRDKNVSVFEVRSTLYALTYKYSYITSHTLYAGGWSQAEDLLPMFVSISEAFY
jgi:hypothetical protein